MDTKLTGKTRIESDLIGAREIPAEALYGVQTLRGIENFSISKFRLSEYPLFIKGLAITKMAAAMANFELGLLTVEQKDAIIAACGEILDGKHHDQFPVDMIQGGAGTTTNMNANEVIANRALELMGHERGEYQYCSPNDHVNCSQSTNDAYPTAIHIGMYFKHLQLLPHLEELIASFRKKGEEFSQIIKMGRTQLEDAVPMTLGQTFNGFASILQDEIAHLNEAAADFLVVNMGATAIGTGICAEPGYAEKCIAALREITGWDIRLSSDLVGATSDTSCLVGYASAMKRVCVKMNKICNDLRLLASGPRCGLGEINLPAMQPGASIMPGKVNPTQCESLTMLAAQVMGNDVTISIAGSNGQFELNVFKPVIISNFLQSARLIGDGCLNFSERCVKGITPVNENIKRHLDSSLMLVTALNPKIGYYKAAAIAQKAYQENKTLREAAIESGYVTAEEFDRWVDPSKMVGEIE